MRSAERQGELERCDGKEDPIELLLKHKRELASALLVIFVTLSYFTSLPPSRSTIYVNYYDQSKSSDFRFLLNELNKKWRKDVLTREDLNISPWNLKIYRTKLDLFKYERDILFFRVAISRSDGGTLTSPVPSPWGTSTLGKSFVERNLALLLMVEDEKGLVRGKYTLEISLRDNTTSIELPFALKVPDDMRGKDVTVHAWLYVTGGDDKISYINHEIYGLIPYDYKEYCKVYSYKSFQTWGELFSIVLLSQSIWGLVAGAAGWTLSWLIGLIGRRYPRISVELAKYKSVLLISVLALFLSLISTLIVSYLVSIS